MPGALEVPCCCAVAALGNSGPSMDSHACIIVCRRIVSITYAIEGSTAAGITLTIEQSANRMFEVAGDVE
jgi:hypothetical protein